MQVWSVNHFPAELTDDLAVFVRGRDVRARRRVTPAWIPVPLGLVALTLHDPIFSRPSKFGTKRTAAHIDGDAHDR